MNIIITCGKSNRFKKGGFNVPKFILPIDDTTVISKILDNYDDSDNFHIVLTNKQIRENSNLKSYLKKLKNIYLNIIDEHDKGPSYSAMAKTCLIKMNNFLLYFLLIGIIKNLKGILIMIMLICPSEVFI